MTVEMRRVMLEEKGCPVTGANVDVNGVSERFAVVDYAAVDNMT